MTSKYQMTGVAKRRIVFSEFLWEAAIAMMDLVGHMDETAVVAIEKEREGQGFRCRRCGRCCRATDHIPICIEDVARWYSQGLGDELASPYMILEWDYFGASRLYRNQRAERCPFLVKVKGKNEYGCRIHNTKPLACREFPRDWSHAKAFCDCPGAAVVERNNIKKGSQ